MKKLMYILCVFAALLFISNVNAQVIRFSPNQSYESYTGVAADTASGTTAKNFDIYVGKDYLYSYEVQVTADSAGDGTDFTVQLYGSNDESSWVTVGDAATWGVSSSTDTVMRFTNIPSSESHGVASYTITTATATDYVNGVHDSVTIDNYSIDDTLTIAQRVATVAAQTITVTKQFPVGWRYLRLTFTGASAGTKGEIERITAIIRKD